MRKYLLTGQEVEVIKELAEGFLVSSVYTSEDDEGSFEEIVDDTKYFVEKVFDKAPTEKYDFEIVLLEEKIKNLKEKLSEIQKIKTSEEGLLNKISSVPGLQMVVDYFTKDFNYYIDDNLEIYERSRIHTDYNISVDLIKGKAVLYSINEHGDRRPVSVFDTKEEVEAEKERLILLRIEYCQWEHQLNEFQDKGFIYNDKLAEAVASKRIKIKENKKAEDIKECNLRITEYTEKLKKLTTE